MKKFSTTKFGHYVTTHKKTSIFILLVLIFLGWYAYHKTHAATSQTSYVLGTVNTGTVVATVSGSGQVASNDTVTLSAQASGQVTYLGATAGETVKAGTLIAELDDTTAKQAIANAQNDLTSAQLSLEKLQEPADASTVLDAQDSLTQAQENLTQEYVAGFNSVSSTFIDMPGVMSDVDSILHGTDVNTSTNGQENISYYQNTAAQLETPANYGTAAKYAADAEAKYTAAKTAYDQTFIDYKNASSDSDTTTINDLVNETYTTANLISDALKSANDLIEYYQTEVTAVGQTPAPKSTSEISTLDSDTSKTTSHISDLLNVQNTITNDTAAIPEQQAKLASVQSGADAIDVQSDQLSIQERQTALQQAKDDLADYFVYAPFDGTVATLTAKKGDIASGSIGTFIAEDEVASITLNEVDVAKIKVGDKATMTFDAVDGLTLTGEVTSIDTIGAVSQGVVSYTVTISFDTTDPRIKPGMTVDADIITQADQDVLMVPNGAVKTTGGTSYVQVFQPALPTTATATTTGVVSETPPTRVTVTTGLSNDTDTEITSGLTDGEQIVVKTNVTSAAKTTTAAAPSATSLLGTGGGARAGGAAGRTGGFGG